MPHKLTRGLILHFLSNLKLRLKWVGYDCTFKWIDIFLKSFKINHGWYLKHIVVANWVSKGPGDQLELYVDKETSQQILVYIKVYHKELLASLSPGMFWLSDTWKENTGVGKRRTEWNAPDSSLLTLTLPSYLERLTDSCLHVCSPPTSCSCTKN